jgi:hypothetical protein
MEERMKANLDALTIVLFSALVTGCGTLPDARPFADATNALSVAVKSSGQALVDSLRDAGSVAPSDKDEYEKIIKDFEAAWSFRVKAAQGAVAYSDAIVDLIAAGKEGAETVKRVGDSLQALAGAINVPLAAPAVGVIGDIARFLLDRIAIVRASKTLEEAVAQAQPAIDRIAEHLADESDSKLKPTLKRAYDNIVSGIKSQYDADNDFAASFSKKRAELRQKAINDSKLIPQLQEFDRVQTTVAISLKERDQKIDQATAAYKARLQLVNALSTATTTWATAHRYLASAIREKRKVNVAELQETVVDLKELIRKVRAL